MTKFPLPLYAGYDNHAMYLFQTWSYEPIPVTLEPWGISLFPIPDYQYNLTIIDALDDPEVEIAHSEGDHLSIAPGPHSILQITDPAVIWIATEAAAYLKREGSPGFPDSERVWESARPSDIADLLTDSRVLEVLRQIRERESAGGTFSEHEFVELVTPQARELDRYDLVLLLREHGMVRKSGESVALTDWGRQMIDMYASPPIAR
jgi:hypothetical protein